MVAFGYGRYEAGRYEAGRYEAEETDNLKMKKHYSEFDSWP